MTSMMTDSLELLDFDFELSLECTYLHHPHLSVYTGCPNEPKWLLPRSCCHYTPTACEKHNSDYHIYLNAMSTVRCYVCGARNLDAQAMLELVRPL